MTTGRACCWCWSCPGVKCSAHLCGCRAAYMPERMTSGTSYSKPSANSGRRGASSLRKVMRMTGVSITASADGPNRTRKLSSGSARRSPVMRKRTILVDLPGANTRCRWRRQNPRRPLRYRLRSARARAFRRWRWESAARPPRSRDRRPHLRRPPGFPALICGSCGAIAATKPSVLPLRVASNAPGVVGNGTPSS